MCAYASICVFGLVYTSVEFIFAALCSGMGPTQEVGQCSASFDWQHFFGEAGSSAIDSVFHKRVCLSFFFLVPLPSFTCFPLLSVLSLSAAQQRALESQQTPPSPPATVTLTKASVLMKVCKKRNDHWSLIPHLCMCRPDNSTTTCRFLSLPSLCPPPPFLCDCTHTHIYTHVNSVSYFYFSLVENLAILDVYHQFTQCCVSVCVCLCVINPAWCIVCELIPSKIFTAANLFNYTTN